MPTPPPSGRDRLARRMAASTGLSIAYCKQLMPHIIDAMRAEILETPKIIVGGLGTFRRKMTSARTRHDPQNIAGDRFPVPPVIVVRFKPAADLRAKAAASTLEDEA